MAPDRLLSRADLLTLRSRFRIHEVAESLRQHRKARERASELRTRMSEAREALGKTITRVHFVRYVGRAPDFD